MEKKIFRRVGVFTILYMLLLSCKKDKEIEPDIQQAEVVVQNLIPNLAAVGQKVQFTGNGFGNDASKVEVLFGDYKAELISLSNSSIESKVPLNVLKEGSVAVVIKVEGKTSNSVTFRYKKDTDFNSEDTIEILDRRELFIDQLLISKMDQVNLVLHEPKFEGSVLLLNEPWEGKWATYSTVIKDGDKYRLYYRGSADPSLGDGNGSEVYCYAESNNGRDWVKPSLNLYSFNGINKNNIILANAGAVTHNFTPFLDTKPNIPANEKYKAIGGTKPKGLYLYASSDGINWVKLKENPILTNDLVQSIHSIFDSQNLIFWSSSEEKYICYFRNMTSDNQFRTVMRTTSSDLINWTKPVYMEYGDSPREQLYTNQTSPYFRAPHIYLAIGARLVIGKKAISDSEANDIGAPGSNKDVSDAFLMTTRGGNQYDRTFMESFIRPGIGVENWVTRTNYPALNVVQTGETEMSVYVNRNYNQPTAYLGRYSLRLDGFSSLKAAYKAGEVLTKPLRFTGSQLEINYSTSSVGSIKIELQGADGTPIEGFTLNDCDETIGDRIKQVVKWKGRSNVSSLSNRPVRMRIVMKDADLYSVKFNNE